MDFIQLVAWLAVAVAIAGVFFWWRARREEARLAAIRKAQETVSEDEAFLDSSHISGPIPGLTDRATTALRGGEPPAT